MPGACCSTIVDLTNIFYCSLVFLMMRNEDKLNQMYMLGLHGMFNVNKLNIVHSIHGIHFIHYIHFIHCTHYID